jgi:hypothetical protein
MRKWVALAKQGRTSRDVIPVNAPATPESAETLEARLNADKSEDYTLFARPNSENAETATPFSERIPSS